MNGKKLQDKFVQMGINALWVEKVGMIFMTAYYGCDCAVQGTYNVYSFAVANDVFEKVSAARAAGDEDPLECWLNGRETNRKYQVR